MDKCQFSILAYIQARNFIDTGNKPDSKKYNSKYKNIDNFNTLLGLLSGPDGVFSIDINNKQDRDMLTNIFAEMPTNNVNMEFVKYVQNGEYYDSSSNPAPEKPKTPASPTSPQQSGSGETIVLPQDQTVKSLINLKPADFDSKVTKSTISENFFGSDVMSFKAFEEMFRNNMFQRSLVNFTTGVAIRNNIQLSESITNYYNSINNDLKQYLKDNNQNYNDDNFLDVLTNYFKDKLKSKTPSSMLTTDRDSFNAYSKFVILKNGFDNLVKLYNLNLIQIKSNLFNKFDHNDSSKYILNNSAKFAFAYGNDNFSVLDETTDMIKTLVDVTPVVKVINGKAVIVDGEYLVMDSLMNTMTKLKKLISSLGVQNQMGQRMNPFGGLKDLMELVLINAKSVRTSDGSIKGLTNEDLDNIRSVYNFYYKPEFVTNAAMGNNIASGIHSLSEIYTKDIMRGDQVNNENDLFVNITAHFDKAVSKLYVATMWNPEERQYELKQLKNLNHDGNYVRIVNDLNNLVNNNFRYLNQKYSGYLTNDNKFAVSENIKDQFKVNLQFSPTFNFGIPAVNVDKLRDGQLANEDQIKTYEAIKLADSILKLGLFDNDGKMLKMYLSEFGSDSLKHVVTLAARATYFINLKDRAYKEAINTPNSNGKGFEQLTFDKIKNLMSQDGLFNSEAYFKNDRKLLLINNVNNVDKTIISSLQNIAQLKSKINGDEYKATTKSPSGASYASVGLLSPIHDDKTSFKEIENAIIANIINQEAYLYNPEEIYANNPNGIELLYEERGNKIPDGATEEQIKNILISWLKEEQDREFEDSQLPISYNLFGQFDEDKGLLNFDKIIGEHLRTDLVNKDRDTKHASKMTASELFTNACFFDFFGGLTDPNSQSKTVGLQPVTYSDKIGQMLKLFDLSKPFIVGGQEFNLSKNVSPEIIKKLHFNTVGNQYLTLKKNIERDYNKMFLGIKPTKALKTHKDEVSMEDIIERFKNIVAPWMNQEGAFTQKGEISKKFKSNTSLAQLAQLKELKLNLDKLSKGKSDFFIMKNIIPYMTEDEIVYAGASKGIDIIHEVHYSGRYKKGKANLSVNNVLDIEFRNYNDRSKQDNRMATEQKKMLRDMLVDNVVIDCYQSDETTKKDFIVKISDYIKNSGYDANFNIDNWIDKETGELIFFKIDGRRGELKDLQPDYSKQYDPLRMNSFQYEVNPILDYFFWVSNTLSTNYNLAVAGGIHGHELKFIERQDVPGMSKEYNDLLFEEAVLSARTTASDKRNVFYQGTIHPYLQDLINGMPQNVKVAVINDLRSLIFNALNQDENFPIMDGAGLQTAKAMILGDNSLGALATKSFTHKLIQHRYNPNGLVAELRKYAVFGITNELLRRGGKNKIDLLNILRKMEDLKLDKNGMPFDLFNEKYNSIPNGGSKVVMDEDGFKMPTYLIDKAMYVLPKSNKVTKVLGFKPVGTNPETGAILYQVKTRTQKLKTGKWGKPILSTETVELNSVFSIWQALGGQYSVERSNEGIFKVSDGTYYKYSEASNYNTVLIMSEYRKLLPGATDLNVASSYDLPLKNGMIYELTNTSSIKNGGANINNSNKWFRGNDEPLHYYTTNTLHWGIQGSFDHGYDEEHAAQVTEMSQVISAAEANGYMHDISKFLYKNIAKVVQLQMGKYDPELVKSFDGRIELYEALTKDLMASLLNKDELGFAQIQLTRVKESLTSLSLKNENLDVNSIYETILTSFSDNNMYSAMISMIAGSVNRTAIKRKYSGIAAVIRPGHDMYTVREDANGLITESSDDGVEESVGPEIDVDQIITMDRVQFSGFDNTGAAKTQIIDFNNIETYYAYKDNNEEYLKNLGFDISKGIGVNLLVNGTRNLNNSRTWIKLGDGSVIDRYDLDSVRAVFGFDDLISKIKDFSKNEKTYLKIIEDRNNKQGEYSEYDLLKAKDKYNKSQADLNNLKNNENYKALIRILPQISNLLDSNPDFLLNSEYASNLRIKLIKEVEKDHVYLKDGKLRKPGTGELIDVEVKKKNAECILSNINRFKYGIEQGTKLSSINLDYFKKKLKNQNTSDFDHCDFYVTDLKNNQLFFLNEGAYKKLAGSAEDVNLEQIEYIDENGESKTYFIDPVTGNKLFQKTKGIEKVVKLNGNNIVIYSDYNAVNEMITDGEFSYTRFGYNVKSGDQNIIKKYIEDYDQASTLGEKALEIMNAYPKNSRERGLEFNKFLNSNVDFEAFKLYKSWIKQLELIAARIPAQSLQSFMTMDVVGFVEGDTNSVILPIAKNWLDGSDFDIDKTYMLGFGINEKGLLYKFNNYFNEGDIEESYLHLPVPSSKVLSEVLIDDSLSPEFVQHLLNTVTYLGSSPLELRTTNVGLFKSFTAVLNEFSESEIAKFPSNFDLKTIDFIVNHINKYNTGLSAKQISEGKSPRLPKPEVILETSKNMVAQTLISISSSIANLMSSERPVDMDAPRGAAKKTTKAQDARELSRENPMTIYKLIIQQNAGKSVVGISAVGEKAFFAYSYFINERINELEKKYANDDTLTEDLKIGMIISELKELSSNTRIPLQYKNKITGAIEKRTIVPNLLANANMNNSPLVQAAYTQLIQNEANADPNNIVIDVQNIDDMSLIISAVLSAATDNAKELILDKINAGPDLAGVYMYMIMQGVSFEKIADVMISNTVNAVVSKSKQNWFTEEGLKASIDSAIKYYSEGVNPRNYMQTRGIKTLAAAIINLKGISKPKDLSYSEFLKSFINSLSVDELKLLKDTLDLKAYITRDIQEDEVDNDEIYVPSVRFKFKINKYLNECIRRKESINHPKFEEELERFTKLKEESEELNIFGRRLSINQGINTTMYDSYNFDYTLDSFLAKRINSAEEGLFVDLNQEAVNAGIISFDSALSDIDLRRAFPKIRDMYNMDKKKQVVFIKMYNKVKFAFNILDAELNLPHFKSMIKAGYDVDNVFYNNSIRYKLHNELNDRISKRIKKNASGYNGKLKDTDFKNVSTYIINHLTNLFLNTQNIEFNLPSGSVAYDENNKLFITTSDVRINLKTPQGKATFKAYFEQMFVPKLMDVKPDNNFVNKLTTDTKKNSITGSEYGFIKLDFNMNSISETNKKNPNQFADIVFSQIKEGFEDLNIDMDGNNVWNMFALYNLLINKNSFGNSTFTKLFQSTSFKNDKSSIIYKFMDFIGKRDFNKDVSIDSDEIMVDLALMRIAEESDSNTTFQDMGDYIKIFDRSKLRYDIYKKTSSTDGQYKYEIVKLSNDSGDLSSYLLDDFLGLEKNSTFDPVRSNSSESIYKSLMKNDKFIGFLNC